MIKLDSSGYPLHLYDPESLINRVIELESAIRNHRDQKADDRCIEDDDRLYEVLRDGIKCDRRVGNKEEMLKNCARFIERRCEGGNWRTYQELEEENKHLRTCLEIEDSERVIDAKPGSYRTTKHGGGVRIFITSDELAELNRLRTQNECVYAQK